MQSIDERFEREYNRALRFLSYRARSEKEIKDYLKRKKADSSIVSKIIKKLKDLSFINDEEFASFWVEQRTRISLKGRRVIKIELRQKGISEEIIGKVLGIKYRVLSEEDLAKSLVEKKLARYRNVSREEFYRKLGQMLGRRGFDFETIRKVIDEFWKKRYNEK